MKHNPIMTLMLMMWMPLAVFSQTDWEKMTADGHETSLPMVNLTVDTTLLCKENYNPGHITIWDWRKRTEGKETVSYDCKMRYRGATSLRYDKKSFAIKLIDDSGEDLDADIFGIREENDWILDAMATDRIRMRNRVLFDIWNEMDKTPYSTDFANRNGTKGQYVELFINEQYHGLYCMTDKIDRKLLNLKKAKVASDQSVTVRGLLYKGDSWTDATLLTGYNDSIPMDSDVWEGWELQYPDDYPSDNTWVPLTQLIDFCISDGDNLNAHAEDFFYMDNVVNYCILLVAHNIIDNSFKNTFLSTPNIENGHRYLFTPWDLDCSLGNLHDGTHNDVYTDMDTFFKWGLFHNLWKYDVAHFNSLLLQRWNELAATILSADSLNRRLDRYAALFEESGAWQREKAKWNNNPVPLNLQEELQYVKDWYAENLSALHHAINQLTGISSPQAEEKKPALYLLNGQRTDHTWGRQLLIGKNRKTILRP